MGQALFSPNYIIKTIRVIPAGSQPGKYVCESMASCNKKSTLFSCWAGAAAIAIGINTSWSLADEPPEQPQIDDCKILIDAQPLQTELPPTIINDLKNLTDLLDSYVIDDKGEHSFLDTQAVFDSFLTTAFHGDDLAAIEKYEKPKIEAFARAYDLSTNIQPWDKFNTFDLTARAKLLEDTVGGVNAYFSILDVDMAYESGFMDAVEQALSPLRPYVSAEYSDIDPAIFKCPDVVPWNSPQMPEYHPDDINKPRVFIAQNPRPSFRPG